MVEPPALSRVVPSPTKGGDTRLVVAARYLQPGMRVALVDDFLANGKTAVALAEIVGDAGAQTVVAGFLVEKIFQGGRAGLEALGIPVATLAQVERLQNGRVIMAESLESGRSPPWQLLSGAERRLLLPASPALVRNGGKAVMKNGNGILT